MIATGVGVISIKSFKLVEIDENFFEIDWSVLKLIAFMFFAVGF